MRRSSRGFTLVEMLVVLGIIGVIAAILFPVLALAREKGRQTVCLVPIEPPPTGRGRIDVRAGL